jgi:hypothetical protein
MSLENLCRALFKDACTCPQCKHPFSYLYVHRQLDGTISDYATEESVCLLKRATWFTQHIHTLDKGGLLGASSFDHEHAYDEDDYEYDEVEDEEESYYFSSASGIRSDHEMTLYAVYALPTPKTATVCPHYSHDLPREGKSGAGEQKVWGEWFCPRGAPDG